MTANNDTPQVLSDGANDDGPFGRQWRDDADAGSYGPWFGWEEQSEPSDADGYPQPSFYGDEGRHDEPESPGYPEVPRYRQEPEYPRGPGYAPLVSDHPGYPPGPGYAPDSDYAHDLGYPHDGWNEPAAEYGHPLDARQVPEAQYPGYAPDLGYGPDPGYGRDPAGIPPMESLLDARHALPEFRTSQAPWPAPGPGFSGAAGRVPPSRSAPPAPAETSDSLTSESLLHGKRTTTGSGWRHRVSRVTGGLLRLGESAADMRRRDLINRVRTPVAGGHHRVAVLSLKGGVGKTTTAVGLGATFATLRGDRVIAVDANPDRGTLSDKVRLETAATVRDLLNERDQIRRYADVRAFTTQAPSRLEVLASDRDPGVSVAFSADDYCDAARVLEHFYSICLTDCGTGLLHSAMSGVLRLADQIVVVSSPSVDGARSASATLDWLEAHNYGDLVRNGVVVLSTIRPRSKSTVDLDRLASGP